MQTNEITNDNNLLNNGAVATDIASDSNLLNNGQVDLADKTNLLSNSDTVEDVQIKAATSSKTQVVSVASEEARTGQTIDVGSPDELYRKAMISYTQNLQAISSLINRRNGASFNVSRKGMNRVLLAALKLPTDEQVVDLKGDERTVFALAQRLLSDRFLIVYKHIYDEQAKIKLEKEKQTVTAVNNEEMNNLNNETK